MRVYSNDSLNTVLFRILINKYYDYSIYSQLNVK